MSLVALPKQTDDSWKPACAAALLLVLLAVLSSALPLSVCLGMVFLFAGPHNYVESRYFLTRLPARLGRLRAFFLVSAAGVVGLSVTLPLAFHVPAWLGGSPRAVLWSVTCWDTALILWCSWLVNKRSTQPPRKNWPFAWPCGFALTGLCLLQPFALPVLLVFAHPLVGLWILDVEIRRSQPTWHVAWRRVLWLIPVLAAGLWVRPLSLLAVSESQFVPVQLQQLMAEHVGGWYLTQIDLNRLVATHAFLELVHYAVWLVAIPLASGRVFRSAFGQVPLMKRSPSMKRLITLMLAVAGVVVVALWLAFAVDYTTTRSVYFAVATLHVLAEIPFLLRIL